jgi:hypothetical protein
MQQGGVESHLKNGGRNRIASIAPTLDWLITKIDCRLAIMVEAPVLNLNVWDKNNKNRVL